MLLEGLLAFVISVYLTPSYKNNRNKTPLWIMSILDHQESLRFERKNQRFKLLLK